MGAVCNRAQTHAAAKEYFPGTNPGQNKMRQTLAYKTLFRHQPSRALVQLRSPTPASRSHPAYQLGDISTTRRLQAVSLPVATCNNQPLQDPLCQNRANKCMSAPPIGPRPNPQLHIPHGWASMPTCACSPPSCSFTDGVEVVTRDVQRRQQTQQRVLLRQQVRRRVHHRLQGAQQARGNRKPHTMSKATTL